jgi:hypothetical protein
MRTSYAVTWQQAGDANATRSGRLELRPRGLVFEGSDRNGSATETVPYDELAGVRIGRSRADRLSGRPTLVLERRTGAPIRIAGIAHPGIVSELAERLASWPKASLH